MSATGDRRRGPRRPAQLAWPGSGGRPWAACSLEVPVLLAAGVPGPLGPQPWIVSSGCSGTATVCRCLRRSDHGDRLAARLAVAGRRADDLAAVAGAEVDVVVVGGGVTGAGVALDAASRGLSVVLLERADLAAGTSRWSSKLVHGGLRYLAHGEIGLARESARERAVLMGSTAPHLVRRAAVPRARRRRPRRDRAGGGRRAPGRRRPAVGARRPRVAAVDPPGAGRRGRAAGARRAAGPRAASSSGTGSWSTTPGWSSRIARTAAAYGARDPDRRRR